MTEIIGPDAQGNYTVVDEQGNVVRTFNGLTQFAGLSSTMPSGTTTIGKDGKALPMHGAAPAPMATDTATPVDPLTQPLDPLTGEYITPQGPVRVGKWQGQTGNDVSYDPIFNPPPADFGGDMGGDPFANVPNYQNGQRHPAAGGAPLTPGGIFAQQDDGFDNRQQVTSTSGATAGPFGVRAAPAPRQDAYGGNAVQGSGGGGGGGNTSPLYDKMRAKGNAIAASLRGIGGGGSSAPGDYPDPTKQYRRQGRRMDRAYDRYNDELADPDPMPVRGWSKDVGLAPGTIDLTLSAPETLLPFVFPNADMTHSGTDPLRDLPMTDLALMTFGTEGRNLMSKTPVVKPPKILRQNGVEPVKPEYKRSLDSSKTANKIAEMYRSLGSEYTGENFKTSELLGNLANVDKKSAVGQGLEQQFRFDPGSALDTMRSYFNTAFTAPLSDNGYTQALAEQVDREVLATAPQYLTRKPKRAGTAIRDMANQFLT